MSEGHPNTLHTGLQLIKVTDLFLGGFHVDLADKLVLLHCVLDPVNHVLLLSFQLVEFPLLNLSFLPVLVQIRLSMFNVHDLLQLHVQVPVLFLV